MTTGTKQVISELMIMGDLDTMSRFRGLANAMGCKLEQRDVYPVIVGEEFVITFLQNVYSSKPAGWERYKSKMIELGICEG